MIEDTATAAAERPSPPARAVWAPYRRNRQVVVKLLCQRALSFRRHERYSRPTVYHRTNDRAVYI